MLLRTAVIVAALLLASANVSAAECDDPQDQQSMNRCAHLEWQEADRRLNDAYRKARAAMRRLDDAMPEDGKGAEVALRDAQRAWITFRDAACATEGWLFRGGSMEPLMVSTCMRRLTERRTEDLESLDEPY